MKPSDPIDPASISSLLPMSLHLAGDGSILSSGRTLRRIIGDHRHFDRAFAVDRPRDVTGGFAGLTKVLVGGGRLFLRPRTHPVTVLRGEGVLLQNGNALLNLGFGTGLPEAVGDFALTDADFSPADLAMELLFLYEANAAVQRELARFNMNLEDARLAAEVQAYTDSLTGLYNRRGFEIALGAPMREIPPVPFALAHLDLDLFKEVNDRLGHAAGDLVLQKVADILRDETRTCDTVARIGGDEFVLILPASRGPDHLLKLARRIISRIEEPLQINLDEVRVSASIGITESLLYPDPDPAEMLADADFALYSAKKTGRGRAVLYRDCKDVKPNDSSQLHKPTAASDGVD